MWIISASGWLFKKKCITMHGNMNVEATRKSKVIGYPTGIRTRYIHSHKSFFVAVEGISQVYCN